MSHREHHRVWKEVRHLKISELQSVCKYDDSVMEELKQCHPKQIISEDISIPIWKVEYKYNTARGNPKTATKYLFLEESAWDMVDNEFMSHIKSINEKYPERKLSNVEILDAEFMGKVYISLE